jgi:glycosyltransferase involved in cell wall biosynthesis
MITENRSRVAHIITTFSRGGSTENTFLTMLGLRALGSWDVTLLAGPANAAEGSMLDEVVDAGIDYDVIPTLQRDISPLTDLTTLLDLTRRLNAGRYDIVHTHGSKAGILGRIAGRLAGIPVVTHTIHGLHYHDRLPPYIKYSYIAMERIAARNTSGVISVAKHMIDRVTADRVLTSGPASVVRSGMDLDAFLNPEPGREEMRKTWGLADGDVAIGTIGRIHHGKGQDVLVRIAPYLLEATPSARIILIGAGPLVEPLSERAQELGLVDIVKFAGFIPPERMPVAISALDVLVHASEREGLARVIPQAMACKRPVISYDLDGSPEVITDGYNGRLVPPYDDTALLNAIIEVAADAELRSVWGSRGPDVVNPAFRAETMALGTDRVYREMLSAVGICAPEPKPLAALSEWKHLR